MNGDADGTVDAVVETVAGTAPEIRRGLRGRREAVDEENPSGETQMAADVHADRLLEERFENLDGIGEYASEERDAVVDVGEGLSVAVDPLDGSSNLKSNNPMGTVFGVFDAPLPAGGEHLLASGFVLYGPITTMVVARDDRVRNYELVDGDRRLIDDDLRVPDDPVVYGFGGGVDDWPEDFTAFARKIERELKLRYGGAMIADVNQVLTYGGLFAYPGLKSRPQGKLRLQFEGIPIANVVEAAGGASSDGSRSLLAIEPGELHQRVPVHVGNSELVDRLEDRLAE